MSSAEICIIVIQNDFTNDNADGQNINGYDNHMPSQVMSFIV
jgi:hypothetical protein